MVTPMWYLRKKITAVILASIFISFYAISSLSAENSSEQEQFEVHRENQKYLRVKREGPNGQELAVSSTPINDLDVLQISETVLLADTSSPFSTQGYNSSVMISSPCSLLGESATLHLSDSLSTTNTFSDKFMQASPLPTDSRAFLDSTDFLHQSPDFLSSESNLLYTSATDIPIYLSSSDGSFYDITTSDLLLDSFTDGLPSDYVSWVSSQDNELMTPLLSESRVFDTPVMSSDFWPSEISSSDILISVRHSDYEHMSNSIIYESRTVRSSNLFTSDGNIFEQSTSVMLSDLLPSETAIFIPSRSLISEVTTLLADDWSVLPTAFYGGTESSYMTLETSKSTTLESVMSKTEVIEHSFQSIIVTGSHSVNSIIDISLTSAFEGDNTVITTSTSTIIVELTTESGSITVVPMTSIPPNISSSQPVKPAKSLSSDMELSTGGKVAMGILIPVAIICLIFFGLFFFRRYKSSKRGYKNFMPEDVHYRSYTNASYKDDEVDVGGSWKSLNDH